MSDMQTLSTNLKQKPSLQVDTETTGFDPHTCELLTIQLGDGEGNDYIIDCKTISRSLIDNTLAELFVGKELVFHNAKFDLTFLYTLPLTAKVLKSNSVAIYDTFLGECLLTAGYEREDRNLGLNKVGMKYLGIEISKDDRGLIHKQGLTPRVIEYCANDVRHLHQIQELQKKELETHNLLSTMELECKVVKVFAAMEYDGVKIDVPKWNTVIQQVRTDLKACSEALDEMVLRDVTFKKFIPRYVQGNLFGEVERTVNINWASPAQKVQVLRLLDPTCENAAESTLHKMKKLHPIVNKLIEYTKLAKVESSFGEEFLKFVNPKTFRVHPNYWQILATGRISAASPKQHWAF